MLPSVLSTAERNALVRHCWRHAVAWSSVSVEVGSERAAKHHQASSCIPRSTLQAQRRHAHQTASRRPASVRHPSPHTQATHAIRTPPVGQLWTYGDGTFGGLANDDSSYASKHVPSLIRSTQHLNFTHIAAGWCKSLALTTDGKCYQWGWVQQIRSLIFAAKLRNRLPSLLSTIQRIPLNTKFTFRRATLQPTLVDQYEIEVQPGQRMHHDASTVQIVDAAVGSDWYALVTSAGHVYTCGNGYWGQLGHSKEIRDTNVLQPKRIEMLVGAEVVQVAAGFNHLLMLTRSGEVYTCGRAQNGATGIRSVQSSNSADGFRLFYPHIIPSTSATMHHAQHPYIGQIVSIAAGMKHSVFLTADGRVYTCGHNLYGELGQLSKNFQQGDIPEPVSSINEPIVKIASGMHHVIALSASGTVYSWGNGKAGQCGRPQSEAVINHTVKNKRVQQEQICYAPGRVQLPLNLLSARDRVIDVSCGFYDTVLHTAQGRSIIMGGNLQATQWHPPRLLMPAVHNVQCVAFGLAHAVALVGARNTGQAAQW